MTNPDRPPPTARRRDDQTAQAGAFLQAAVLLLNLAWVLMMVAVTLTGVHAPWPVPVSVSFVVAAQALVAMSWWHTRRRPTPGTHRPTGGPR